MTMSSSRKAKSFQTVESKWWLCSSRVLRGHIAELAFMFYLQEDGLFRGLCSDSRWAARRNDLGHRRGAADRGLDGGKVGVKTPALVEEGLVADQDFALMVSRSRSVRHAIYQAGRA